MPKSKRIWATLDPFYEGGPILGRKVANTSFLEALLRADRFDEYHFFLMNRGSQATLEGYLKKAFPALVEADRVRLLLRQDLPEMLAGTEYHCFHLSDCITSQPFLARMRNLYSERIFPITGVIHSLSYAHYPDGFMHHLWPGTTARDAIVCTSTAGRQAVEKYFDQLRSGFNLTPDSHPAPALPRIPLAVATDACMPGEDNTTGPVRILVFGRISHYSKMDLVPLLRALHRLITDGMDPSAFELVLAGWTDDDDSTLNTLTNLAANAGIDMKVHSRPDEAEKAELFRSADIFVSIADNPQETFGITVAEAAAFGLPVVASDYDGYRDIVEHETTGLLVPTIGPDSTPDVNAMAPLSFDNHYHLHLAQRTGVDMPALAASLKQLIDSPDRRKSMGEAARKRAESTFSWPVVMDRYMELWDGLWNESADAEPLRDIQHPMAPDFGRLFGHYTTEMLSDDTMLATGRVGEAFYRDRDYPNLYGGLHDAIDLDVTKKLAFFARNPVDTATLIRKIFDIAPLMDITKIKNHILWALKQDILQRT